MKKILLLFVIAIGSLTASYAGTGDTTHVVVHSKTYVNFYGDFYKWDHFPAAKQYNKVTMLFTFNCPSGGCSDYDYTHRIYIRSKGGLVNNVPVNIEIARIINPFGIDLKQTWSRTYRLDVTDYAYLLSDSVEIGDSFEGYPAANAGWLMTTDFEMIEGTPAREAYKVENIWNGYFPFGEPGSKGDTIESFLTPKNITIDPQAAATVLRIRPSGHGQGAPENCAEFCQKSYRLLLNGNQIAQKSVWRDDCGLNPVYPGIAGQGNGTWIYDRSNWCPGQSIIHFDHELTSLVTAGNNYTVDVNFDTGVKGSNTGFHFQSQLISYRAPSFTLNAAMEDIVSPSDYDDYARMNPICNNPEIVIKNNGTTNLTSLTITYGVEGAASQQTYNWTGNLKFLETTHVQLGSVDMQTPNTTKRFYANVSNPNGGVDEYNFDNNKLTSFTPIIKTYPEKFRVAVRTNNDVEDSYKITNVSTNTVVYSKILSTPNKAYLDTINLPEGCYKFELLDTGKDGLSYPFTTSTSGSGSVFFKKLATVANLNTFEPNFGTSIVYYFNTKGSVTTGIEDESTDKVFALYPNPTAGIVNIDMEGLDAANKNIIITSLTGQQVYSKVVDKSTENSILELEHLDAGIYFVNVLYGNKVYREKLVIAK